MIDTLFSTANAAETGAGLTNPNNAQADDGTYATAAPGKNVTLATKYQNFNFEQLIAVGTTITKVELIYEYKVSTQSSIATGRTYYKISGAAGSNNDDTTEPLADTQFVYDVTSARSWTRDDLLNGVFEVVLAAVQGNSSTAVTFSFDYVQARVTYTKGTVGMNNYMGGTCVSTGVISVAEKIR